MKIKLEYIIILVLGVLLILQHQCSSSKLEPQIVVERDTLYETITKIDSIPNPYPVYVEKVKWDTIVDTVEVLGDYFSIKTFENTYSYGDTLSINVTDTIFKNNLEAQHISYTLNIPVIRERITVIQNQHEVYVGPKVGVNPQSIQVGLDLSYRNPYGQMYNVYYYPFQKEVGIGVQWRVFKTDIKEINLPQVPVLSPL